MTSPVSLPSGSKITAAKLDAYENLTSAWTSYTPTWSTFGPAPVLGNGTLQARYMQAGKLVHFAIALTIGSTTNPQAGQLWRFTAPVTSQFPAVFPITLEDTSAGLRWVGSAVMVAGTTAIDRVVAADGTSGVGGSAPFTWATGDIFWLSGTYEAA